MKTLSKSVAASFFFKSTSYAVLATARPLPLKNRPHTVRCYTDNSLPSFSPGDVISFSASTTRTNCPPDGYRVIKKSQKSIFSEAAARYPGKLEKLLSQTPLIINAYPAFIPPPANAVLVDTYLSLNTASRALQLAAIKQLPAVLVAQPLFAIELLLHHQRGKFAFPEHVVLLIGGYPLPASLSQAIHAICKESSVQMTCMVGYGVAEIDAGLFYAMEQNLQGEWLYYPRSDVNCEIVDPDAEGFGRLLLSTNDSGLVDVGDLAKKENTAYIIRSNPKKAAPEVLNLLETWSVADWKRKTGYMKQEWDRVYFQLRENQLPENSDELPFFSYAAKFKFSWQEKPKWIYVSESKLRAGNMFFNQFHCIDPTSEFVRNYLYPTSKGLLLAEEILNLPSLLKEDISLNHTLRIVVSEIIAKSLNNKGVSDVVITNKLNSDSLTILRNNQGEFIGVLSFSCSNFEGNFMSIGIHLLPEARNGDVLKIHNIISAQRAMAFKKSDYMYRVSKTHSPIALHVEQKMSKLEPNIKTIKIEFDRYIRDYVQTKLRIIGAAIKKDDQIQSEIDTLNALFDNYFILLKEKNFKNRKMQVTPANWNEWLNAVDHMEINLSKLMHFKKNKYKNFPDFKLMDKKLREIFSNEIRDIKPLAIAYIESLIGKKAENSSYFDKDYLVHKKADPSYNLSEVLDGPTQEINQFLRGVLNYRRGDIFTYCVHVTEDQLLDLKNTVVQKLPITSQAYFWKLEKISIRNAFSDKNLKLRNKKIPKNVLLYAHGNDPSNSSGEHLPYRASY